MHNDPRFISCVEDFRKAQMALTIKRLITRRALPVQKAAKMLGTSQLRLRRLINGGVAEMPLATLVEFQRSLERDPYHPRATSL